VEGTSIDCLGHRWVRPDEPLVDSTVPLSGDERFISFDTATARLQNQNRTRDFLVISKKKTDQLIGGTGPGLRKENAVTLSAVACVANKQAEISGIAPVCRK